MSFIYQARDLNRIPNAFFISGADNLKESHESTAIFSYSSQPNTWASARSAINGQVGGKIFIQNRFDPPNYTIARTGIQFETTWGVVPVGMVISIPIDLSNNLPFKIRAFKGTTSALTGVSSEYSIPLNQGLVPFSEELEVTEYSVVLYFNQTAIDAFLANPNQNVFILGEYDYNNIEPTETYFISNSDSGAVVELTGQT